MLQQKTLPADASEQSEQIYLAAQRAASLTRQLLTFSRKQLLRLRTADLNLVVTSISKMLTRVIGEDVVLKVECSSELLLVEADENLLEQVLTNLAVNARDAMTAGGRLSISTGRVAIGPAGRPGQLNSRPGEYVWMRVRDNGSGMTPDIRARIFEPFFTTKDVGKGTGLGLPTVYSIVRQHLGWIEVESEIGVGTSFTIFFPAAVSLRASATPFETAGRVLPHGDETILLVEDELALQKMTARVLTNLGYRVYAAGNGHAALVKWSEHREEIDLLLTDIVMPGSLAGTDLAEKLRSQDPNLRVVLTSGYNAVPPEATSPKSGVKFLAKPYTLEELSRMIRTSLDELRLRPPPDRRSAHRGAQTSSVSTQTDSRI
jgi:two-component system cell cycle sensor histidine kinase/response regulator CckA